MVRGMAEIMVLVFHPVKPRPVAASCCEARTASSQGSSCFEVTRDDSVKPRAVSGASHGPRLYRAFNGMVSGGVARSTVATE